MFCICDTDLQSVLSFMNIKFHSINQHMYNFKTIFCFITIFCLIRFLNSACKNIVNKVRPYSLVCSHKFNIHYKYVLQVICCSVNV